jgi:uncharacterized repeat protein (TIGR03803 family)
MKKTSVRIVTCVASVFLMTFGFAVTASAVSERVIYTFAGLDPLTKPVFFSGKLYGATTNGGAACNCGTVYQLTPEAGGNWTYETLYEFQGGSDGLVPVGNIIFDADGNLYGVTGSGGTHGFGTVYELSPSTGGEWTHTVLYSFKAEPDGNSPDAGLIMDAAGDLYGTTRSGGNNFMGTVFKLRQSSSGHWTETVLYRFGSIDGDAPQAELIMDAKRNLYGTTVGGGANSDGVVFELSPVSGGGWSESVLYSFTGGQDQGKPEAPVWMDSKGNLYGTTIGTENNVLFGTVFELTPASGGTWTETTLHTFGLQQSDGAVPAGGLTPDAAGNLYGTTDKGGSDFAGTVYKLTRGSDGTWAYNVFYTFTSGTNGGNPSTPVTLEGGSILGATTGGPDNGEIGAQVVYEITP